MKNLFSSPTGESDFQKFIIKQLDTLLNEQRKQRMDLAQLLRLTNRNINDTQLQHKVDEYYEDAETDMPEAEK